MKWIVLIHFYIGSVVILTSVINYIKKHYHHKIGIFGVYDHILYDADVLTMEGCNNK